ncbi:MAG: flagellar biosynthesis protein FlhF [Phycisphaerae bacterium]|nr:flagellar biosynthesis protein FlhF [Phycisphaerae bacterium]
MDLKTYQGSSMAEALERVKTDLGADAVILHTRTVRRGGVLGVGARNIVEITASRDPRLLPAAERRAMAGRVSQVGRNDPPSGDRLRDASAERLVRDLYSARPTSSSVATRAPRSVPSVPAAPPRPFGDLGTQAANLQNEINEIRAMVRELLSRPVVNAPVGHLPDLAPDVPEIPDELRDYYTRLLQNAVAEELAHDVIQRARQRLDDCRARIMAGVAGKLDDAQADKRVRDKLRDLIPAVLMESIERMLPAAGPLEVGASDRGKVVALVGPTGVGKTTTVAKLAAHFKLREGRSVGLITIDTYRIAAVDQLRAYADIMALPLEVVFTPQELAEAIKRLGDCDLILVDTSGRSHRDAQRLADLRQFLDAGRAAVESQATEAQTPAGADGTSVQQSSTKRFEVHLLLSCTGHRDQLIDVAERFSSLGVDGVVFTKLDEAVGAGVVLNVATRLKWHMSYLTTGQEVPDDIEIGHRRRIAELLLQPAGETASPGRSGEAQTSCVDQLA